eukprot:TRINITY_DN2561_c0_g1_i1.p1 TRINITY_DN2561_c0_g1~~TRINITY_DN2561_c0_g1_i1.p1  ORF type:complete len:857 (-),score=315.12 TRINITY_DN2561_c0_g1_i1:19-2493(-)
MGEEPCEGVHPCVVERVFKVLSACLLSLRATDFFFVFFVLFSRLSDSHVIDNRPWKTPIEPLAGSITEKIYFPDDEEETGTISIGWRAPNWSESLTDFEGYKMLWEYLTHSAVAPLQATLVENESPTASDLSPMNIVTNGEGSQQLWISTVPVEKLDSAEQEVLDALNKVLEEGIDVERMHSLIRLSKNRHFEQLEESANDYVATMVINDFIYGEDERVLQRCLEMSVVFDALLKYTADDWANMLKTVIEQDRITVIGVPSKQKSEEMAEEEKERIAKQVETLGDEKLKELAAELERSIQVNDVEAPGSVFEGFNVPDATNIPMLDCKAWQSWKSEDIDMEGNNNDWVHQARQIPVRTQVNHIKSAFVSVYAYLDTSELSFDDKMLMVLLSELLFKTDVIDENGQRIPYDDVVNQLTEDTVMYSSGHGLSSRTFTPGEFSAMFRVSLKSEASKYETAVSWLLKLLFSTEFPMERLKVAATNLINEVSEVRRRGQSVASLVRYEACFAGSNSTYRSLAALRQVGFLTKFLEDLNDESAAAQRLEEFEGMRKRLINPKNLTMHIVGDMSKISDVCTVWKGHSELSEVNDEISVTPTVKYDVEYQTDALKNGANIGYVAGLGSIESSFLYQVTPGPSHYEHEDKAPLMVAMEYLMGMEGVFWKQIRGQGFAYGAHMGLQIDRGIISFDLYRSANVVAAYEASKDIVEGFLNGKYEFEQIRFESSISVLVYEIVQRSATRAYTARQSLYNVLRRSPKEHNEWLLEQIKEVTLDDVKRVMQQYLSKLFDNETSLMALACPSSKAKEINEQFVALGRQSECVEDLEEFFK